MRKFAASIVTLGAIGMLGLVSADVSAATIKKKSNADDTAAATVSQTKSMKRSVKATNPASDRMLNPQPLPPGKRAINTVNSPGSDRMLNPQPLPPGKHLRAAGSPGSDVMLNPQPLPPGKRIGTVAAPAPT